MRSIVQYTIRQTVFINVVFVILVVAGAFSIFKIPLENMPLVDMGQVFINTVYFGAPADDVEQLVTRKIEDAIDGMENIEYIQSKSYRNFSSVKVKFIDDTDYRKLYDELRFRVLNIQDELPQGADEPGYLYIDTYMWLPVVVVNISGPVPQPSLELYADELKSQLLGIANVRTVEMEGDFEREFHVSLDPAKLRKTGVTFQQVVAAIESTNTKIPSGRFRQGKVEYMLDAGRRLDSRQSALDVIVRRDGDGNFVRVRDLVAAARPSHRDPRMIPSINGANTLRLLVTKEEEGNAVTISEAVKQTAREFEKLHAADGVKVVFTNDSTFEINDSLNTLGGNLILGLSLVIVVLWLTLGFRNAMLTTIGIPFSFLCAVIIMKITGVSMNTICLFSFVLVTGIVVDDAVIIIENIFRHLQMGKSKREAVVDGTAEVMLPVTSAALTTVLAFLPMLIMTGSTGEFFSYVPKTVTFAMIASVVEALFILPIHVLDWGPKPKYAPAASNDENSERHLQSGLFAPLWRIYRWLVIKILDHKFVTFTLMTVIFVGTVGILVLSVTGIAPLIKVKFFPGNYFRYHVTINNPVGTSLERTDTVVRDISKFIMAMGPGVAHSAAGSAGFYEDQDYVRYSGSSYGQIVVTMPEQKDQQFPDNPTNDPMRHLEYMRNQIETHVQDKYAGTAFIPKVRVFEESDGPPTGKPVNIRVTAETLDEAIAASDRIMAFMRQSSEMADLIGLEDNRPEYHRTYKFVPRQEKLYEYGLNAQMVTALAAGALNGQTAGRYRLADEEVDLKVRLARADDEGNNAATALDDPLDVLNVPAIEDSAAPVLLRDLVDYQVQREPNLRSRYKGRPTITIASDIRPGAKLSPARVRILLLEYYRQNQQQLSGVSLSFGGEFESTSKSYTSLTFAFFIAVLLIYLVLASQFNDYMQPLIIIAAVPFALIGVVVGLFLTRTTFTIGSFLAIVGLAGIAVNDSLILIDFMNVRARQRDSLRDAILEACAARMRPVIITTITTMLGLLPMAIGIPNRSITWAPMATAFVAGLSSATILTLLITPANYELLYQSKALLRRLKPQQSQKTISTDSEFSDPGGV